tara:strand:- start:4848 stop:6914 length:2067 start_codon:yes stop_codon:yes gene_type:complete
MKKMQLLIFFFIHLTLFSQENNNTNRLNYSEYGLIPVAFNEVILEDKFWKPRLITQVETLVPFALDKTINAQIALRQTGNFLSGIMDSLPKPHAYQSSDLYKVMEGAAYLLFLEENRALEKRMDDIIDLISSAQKKDGYLYVGHITGVSGSISNKIKDPTTNRMVWMMGDKPYSNVIHSHELYNMGHMYEGAIAYYQATGKDKWLKIAEKSAQHINKVFFEGDPNYNNGKPVNQAPGHQELELALTKLYRITGNKLYLNMAKKFLDIRGKTFIPNGEQYNSPIYAQQHLPVTEQRKAVGHAVRATYLYSGMADVGGLFGISDYDKALKSIWNDIVDKKMSITGGLGAVQGIEGFGSDYVLPNKESYNETCAAVGNVFFNFRMFLRTRDARYMDVAEISLLNNSLAGVNIEGNKFFYVNPLEADGTTKFNHGNAGRSEWFNTACCPSNIARLIPQVSGMMYSFSDDEIYLTFYGSNSSTIKLESGMVRIKQKSEYPFDGKVDLTVSPKSSQRFKLKLRIPSWVNSNQFVPGELYSYDDKNYDKWKLSINGVKINAKTENGFVTIDRLWNVGDKVILDLPMTVRINKTINKVKENKNRVAITRGPLVYVAEGIDNYRPVQEFYIEDMFDNNKIKIKKINSGILENVVSIIFPAKTLDNKIEEIFLKMIPYYAWNNRENSSMIVWIPFIKK